VVQLIQVKLTGAPQPPAGTVNLETAQAAARSTSRADGPSQPPRAQPRTNTHTHTHTHITMRTLAEVKERDWDQGQRRRSAGFAAPPYGASACKGKGGGKRGGGGEQPRSPILPVLLVLACAGMAWYQASGPTGKKRSSSSGNVGLLQANGRTSLWMSDGAKDDLMDDLGDLLVDLLKRPARAHGERQQRGEVARKGHSDVRSHNDTVPIDELLKGLAMADAAVPTASGCICADASTVNGAFSHRGCGRGIDLTAGGYEDRDWCDTVDPHCVGALGPGSDYCGRIATKAAAAAPSIIAGQMQQQDTARTHRHFNARGEQATHEPRPAGLSNMAPPASSTDGPYDLTAVCITVAAAVLVAVGTAHAMRSQSQRQMEAEAFQQKEERRLADLARYRQEQVLQMRRERLRKTFRKIVQQVLDGLAAERRKLAMQRRRQAIDSSYHPADTEAVRAAWIARLQPQTAMPCANPANAAQASSATMISTCTNPSCNNPHCTGCFQPAQRHTDTEQAALGLREEITVIGLDGRQYFGQALLDTGNAAYTVITRQFAEAAGLIGADGNPIGINNPQTITIGGAVAGAHETQVVCPCVQMKIGGVQLVANVTIAADGGIERNQDVIISMADIQQLVDSGQARFDPTAR
jgi:predicted aspartyl protease